MSNLLAFKKQTKICSSCKSELSLDCFSLNSAAKDKLQYSCRDCQIARLRKRDKSVIKQYSIKYRNQKRNDLRWRLMQLLNSSKARSILKNREHTITLEDLLRIYPVDGNCPIFGFKLEWNSAGFRETSPSIDRIDSSKGYTIDNVQIISWKANRIKNYATVEELEMIVSYLKSGG